MQLKPLSYNQISRIVESCTSTLKKTHGANVSAKRVTRTQKIDSRDAAVRIGAKFNGEVKGRVLLGFSDASACATAERIHKHMWQESVQFTQVDDTVYELLREFANMLFNEIAQSFHVEDIRCAAEAAERGGIQEWEKDGQELLLIPFSMGILGNICLFLNLNVYEEREETNKRKRIMIVDDSASLRGAMKDILERAGYLVVGEAANGREAIANIGVLAPDLVTMDIEMPEINGVQALAAIRVSHPSVKVVMVTSVTDKGKVLDCLGKGASNYVLKPYEATKVLDAVARALT